MSLSAPQSHNRAHIERTFPDVAGGGGYELRTAFPARAYADDAQTLEGAGLVPNASLLLHRRRGDAAAAKK